MQVQVQHMEGTQKEAESGSDSEVVREETESPSSVLQQTLT